MYTPTKVYSLISVNNLYTVFSDEYEKGFAFLGEAHDFWEINVISDGQAVIVSDNNVYNCKAGDLLIHAPNTFHSMRVDDGNYCRVFTVSFDGTGLSKRLASGQYMMLDGERKFVDVIISEFEKVGFDKTSLDNIGMQIIKNQLEILCLSLISRGERARGLPSADARSRTYAKIVAYLRDNVDRNLTVDDISRAVFESPTKIKDIFRSYTGGGVMQYFNRLRCEHIIYLLNDGKSVKDIAAIMEFSSPYYLSYFFKREMGMTIREYKNTL